MAARPAAVVLLGTDLFFSSRVEAAARRLGLPYTGAPDAPALRRELERTGADLVLIDLGSRVLDLAEAVAAVRSTARPEGSAKIVAFGPHRDVAGRARALAAGCDEWLANSKLAAALPGLLGSEAGSKS